MSDLQQALADAGSTAFKPLQRAYIQALLRRAATQPPAVRQQMEDKAASALQRYETAYANAAERAHRELEQACERYPQSAAALQALFAAGDFRSLRLRLLRLRSRGALPGLAALHEQFGQELEQLTGQLDSPLASRLRHQEQAALGEDLPAGSGANELRASRRFRDALHQHDAQRLVSHSIRSSHPESGPLNPERLMVDSLRLMRDISPRYLGRLVAQVDTLFWLEKAKPE